MEKLWEDFYKKSLSPNPLANTTIKEISLGGRGWQRYASHNFTGGLLGRGHERRWLTNQFVHRLVFGLDTDDKAGITGVEKFTLGYGSWAAELSLGGKFPKNYRIHF